MIHMYRNSHISLIRTCDILRRNRKKPHQPAKYLQLSCLFNNTHYGNEFFKKKKKKKKNVGIFQLKQKKKDSHISQINGYTGSIWNNIIKKKKNVKTKIIFSI